MTKLKRQLLSTATMQPVQPQRAAPPNKSFQAVKCPPPRDNPRAKRRSTSTADDRNDDGCGDGNDGDGDDSDAPRRRMGTSYKLGPHPPKTVPAGAIWMTSNQVCARYGGKSHMWLWRKIKRDPDFPKPVYFGRMMMFSIAEQDGYDRIMIAKRVGADR
jgi:predicted DNA-binding transcriptional regulator AlpA